VSHKNTLLVFDFLYGKGRKVHTIWTVMGRVLLTKKVEVYRQVGSLRFEWLVRRHKVAVLGQSRKVLIRRKNPQFSSLAGYEKAAANS
jgi:hypothetical protein